jgi:integrase
MLSTERPLDAAGHHRSPVTMPGYHRGRPPKNKGLRFPADPPTVEEIVAVLRAAGEGPDGTRLRALIVVLWRAGLRISEALDLAETDLDRSRGALVIRRGKGGRRREVGMDRWAWDQLTRWQEIRATLPVGSLFCVIHGPTAGRRWEASAARKQLRRAAEAAGVRRRVAHISSAMRTPSRWLTKASRWSSYRGSSGMPTSGSRRFTCRESTAPRSSTLSIPDPRRSSQPPPACA